MNLNEGWSSSYISCIRSLSLTTFLFFFWWSWNFCWSFSSSWCWWSIAIRWWVRYTMSMIISVNTTWVCFSLLIIAFFSLSTTSCGSIFGITNFKCNWLNFWEWVSTWCIALIDISIILDAFLNGIKSNTLRS